MRVRHTLIWLSTCLIAAGPVLAQVAPPSPPVPDGAPSQSRHHRWNADGFNSSTNVFPRWSPTEFLRNLLALDATARQKAIDERLDKDKKFWEARYADHPEMTPEDRAKAVTEKVDGGRKFWAAKLAEYDALKPEEREVRLKTTERTISMHFYLRPLMRIQPSERAARLAAIPAADRKLVEERLKIWDGLSPERQQEYFDNEMVMQYLARVEATPPDQRSQILQQYSPNHRKKLEDALAVWMSQPKEQRQRTYDTFLTFFQLSDKEKDKVLDTLSDSERHDMEKSLQAFEKLPPDQRKTCIESFRKFANMTPQQRDEFLKNAERWKHMSASERETWRSLVTQLPPLPPGFGPPAPVEGVPSVPKVPSPSAVTNR